jgi:hypothetical protein
MKVEIKRLVGTKWRAVPIEDLLNMSIAQYIAQADTKATAALYQDDKAVAFISNDNTIVEKLRAKGLSMHAEDALILFAEKIEKADLVAKTFKEAIFIERRLTKEKP